MMAITSPLALGVVVAAFDGDDQAVRVVVAVLGTLWIIAFLVFAALSMRRNDPPSYLVEETPPADSLALDIDDPERDARLKRAKRDADRARIDDPPEQPIPPYILP